MNKGVFYVGLALLLISFVLEEIIAFFVISNKSFVNLKPFFLISKIIIVAIILGIHPYAEKNKNAFGLLIIGVYALAFLTAIATVLTFL
jgi:hypothetical protein